MIARLITFVCLFACHLNAGQVSLFDGKSLAGWECPEDEKQWWRVENGEIVGGSLEKEIKKNIFLSTTKRYQNFDLRLKIKIEKGSGFVNSGIQVRSIRGENGHMKGYQVDAGIGYWGDLYDEHRRKAKIGGAVNPDELRKVVKDWDWNEMRILCEGRRIRSWINGVPALDYTEEEKDIPLDGHIGFQVHSGGKLLVRCKDITIEKLPETSGAPSWATATKLKTPTTQAKPAGPPKTLGKDALTPAEQLETFELPPGFIAELVASEEEGVGKPITIAWDAKGRMWTMTALEYPVDGNENPAVAEALYARGGKDRLLVFDNPGGPLPLRPRVFAEGLAIPLGILPDLDGDGALVHHGSQIRHYIDTNGDGKADRHEVILDGFGVQDSHLMPHQFERAPGGWVYLAQGLFNSSKVVRPNSKPFLNGKTEIPFNACKLARFRPDGSEFELLTAGPNNIWGLTLTRTGEVFLQEANDMGIPIAEFEPGTHYESGSNEKLQPYAPVIPKSMNERLGGTGLSGLAVADDFDSLFASHYGGEDVVYVANPITGKIQVISTKRDHKDQHPEYKLRGDFLVSKDPWFRPVGIKFGPDGFLYITDWYNKIISHNEVPRNHPDRDKSMGRIWRIRPADVTPEKPVDLVAMNTNGLARMLVGPSQLNASMAWQLLGERKTKELKEPLAKLSTNTSVALESRIAAIHALEAINGVDGVMLKKWYEDEAPEVRYEALRVAGEMNLDPAQFVAIFGLAANDPNYRVRAALANAVRHHHSPTPAMMAAVTRLGKAPLQNGSTWDQYDRRFERYLARWAMEIHAPQTEEMLAIGTNLEPEARLLALLSQPPQKAAAGLISELSRIERPLDQDELALFGSQIEQPEVLKNLETMLMDPKRRVSLLQSFTRLDPKILSQPKLALIVTKACQSMIGSASAVERALILKLTQLLRLKELEEPIVGWITANTRPTEVAEILAALREIGSSRVDIYTRFLEHPDDGVRRSAVSALAAVEDPRVVGVFATKWNKMPGALRALAIDGLTSSKAKASALATEAAAGKFGTLGDDVYERLALVLGDESDEMVELLSKVEGGTQPVIRFPGEANARIASNIDLEGAFTVETWVRLDEGIDNNDGLLGRNGGPDMNFYEGRLRVYDGEDLIVANRAIHPSVWTHCAITRSSSGKLKIYLDGSLDQEAGKPSLNPLKGLNIGETHKSLQTGGSLTEFRVWDVERSGDEILESYRKQISGDPPPNLRLRISGDQPGKLEGPAKVVRVRDFPELVTPQQAAEDLAKFTKFKSIVSKPGDAAAGKLLFQASCMICHQVNGEGIKLGPDLSGVDAMGVDAVLRNILDPSAQLESGYYRHDITLTDGTVISGFMIQDTKETLMIQPIGGEVRVIDRSKIGSHHVSKSSLMPKGLLDGFEEKQIQDLFSYLMGPKK